MRRGRGGTVAYLAYDAAGFPLRLAARLVAPLLPTRATLAERFGRIPPAAQRLPQPVWVHAASVGEVLAAAVLVDQIRQHWPARPVVMSTTSVSGRETARQRVAASAAMLLPLDVSTVVEGVMRAIAPCALVLVETEIWPALIRAAARQGVPCVLVSGRVSARAAARYAWVRWLTRAALAQVRAFAMQSETDARRIVALGAPADRVEVIGSLKFARVPATQVGIGQAGAAPALVDGRVMLVAASTHAGEEQVVLEACAPLWREHPGLLLLLAPRRPERFDEVSALLAHAGMSVQRRSALDGRVARSTQVLLLDTLGELPNFLPGARAVFVGGTLVPVGGHNVLEPALRGRPVAFGPHTENVAAAADALLDAGAAERVRAAGDLRAAWRRLLRAPAAADAMGARGRAVIAARAAVAERTFDVLRRCVELRG
ncbi:MAG: glycosyltransferase N-terminal domain-containing protein [Candidatus Binatia bacterium]